MNQNVNVSDSVVLKQAQRIHVIAIVGPYVQYIVRRIERQPSVSPSTSRGRETDENYKKCSTRAPREVIKGRDEGARAHPNINSCGF